MDFTSRYTNKNEEKILLRKIDDLIRRSEKEYTVTIFAARYLSKVRLYHNGQPTSVDNSITFNDEDYHPDTGYLTFRTKGFSMFTVVGEEAAVRIGENKMYST